jgi:hypothetical protein
MSLIVLIHLRACRQGTIAGLVLALRRGGAVSQNLRRYGLVCLTDVPGCFKVAFVQNRILKNWLCSVLAVLLLTCCATVGPLDTARRGLDAAAACCSSYAQIHYEPLVIGSAENITIDGGSPAYPFDTGKSYFKAYRLPVTAKPYAVFIHSFVVESQSRSGDSYVFRPVVMFLDAGFNVTRTLEKDFDASINSGDSLNQASLQMRIAVNPRALYERYMVIYTTAERLGQATLLKVYKYARYGTIIDKYPLPNAPIGELKVNAALSN